MKKYLPHLIWSLILTPSFVVAAEAKGDPNKFILYNSTTFEIHFNDKKKRNMVEVDWWISRQKLNSQPRLDLRHQPVPLSINKAMQLANDYLRKQPNYSQYLRLNDVLLQPIDGRSEADYATKRDAIWTGRYCYEVSFAKKDGNFPDVVIVLLDGTVVKPTRTLVKDAE